MTNELEITCIVCPIGCKILVKSDGKKVDVLSGYKCKKGIDYALYETLDPRRILTSSVLVKNGEWPLVSVKSSQPLPKKSLFPVIDELYKIVVNAPINSGDIIIQNVLDTNIDILATKTVKKR